MFVLPKKLTPILTSAFMTLSLTLAASGALVMASGGDALAQESDHADHVYQTPAQRASHPGYVDRLDPATSRAGLDVAVDARNARTPAQVEADYQIQRACSAQRGYTYDYLTSRCLPPGAHGTPERARRAAGIFNEGRNPTRCSPTSDAGYASCIVPNPDGGDPITGFIYLGSPHIQWLN